MSHAATIRIDLSLPTPAYRQIVDAVRVLLVEGALTPGTPLPSVRRLAMDLGVHFNTVSEAYRQLADEGWIDLRQGRSAVVIERGGPVAAGPERVQEFRTQLRNLIAQMRAAGVTPSRIAAELRSLEETLQS